MSESSFTQQGDVDLYQSVDGGDIDVTNGLIAMSGGLETAVYLSLWGGNEDCTGRPDCPLSWWGNFSETDKAYKQISVTQYLLKTLPAIPANLRRIEDAITNDLQWLLDKKIASKIEAHNVSITGPNKIKIVIRILAEGLEKEFEYIENWKAGT